MLKTSKMHNILHKLIKSTLGYFILFAIIGQLTTLKAAAPAQQPDPLAHHNKEEAKHLNTKQKNPTQLDLQGLDLTKTKLPQNLSGANLAEAKLPQDLSMHNLTYANLSKTNLTHVLLPQDLTGVNFTAAKLPQDLSMHNLTYANLSKTNLTHVRLPKNLAATKLTHANLTGQHFTSTDFTNAQLDKAILTYTTCNYQQYFQHNAKANKLSGGRWYFNNLPKDLKSIAQVYLQCLQDVHKAELLQIACGLAQLPYDEDEEFYIKIQYWSCKLLLLKKQLGNGLGDQLVCSLACDLNRDAAHHCWQTNYPFHLEKQKGMQIAAQWCISTTTTHLPGDLGTLVQHYLTEPAQTIHANFDQYLQIFQEGLVKYNVKSKHQWAYKYYKANIEKNIQSLKKAYPKLISQKLRKEASNIACQLSEQYKIQHLFFLFHFLTCQNRLIQLKILAGVRIEYNIHYNSFAKFLSGGRSWSRG